jgi:hypothetical protein
MTRKSFQNHGGLTSGRYGWPDTAKPVPLGAISAFRSQCARAAGTQLTSGFLFTNCHREKMILSQLPHRWTLDSLLRRCNCSKFDRRACNRKEAAGYMGLLAHDTLFRDGLFEHHAGAPMHVEGGPRPIAQPGSIIRTTRAQCRHELV